MLRELHDMAEVFETLHDGSVARSELRAGTLQLEVQIEYLARRIAPNYRSLRLKLHAVRDIAFHPWSKSDQLLLPAMTDVTAIFQPPLEILSCEVEDGKLQISCNQPSPQYPYVGGELRFHADAMEVSDEAGRPLPLEELRSLCESYWSEWSRARSLK
jgi:hypothetical protein